MCNTRKCPFFLVVYIIDSMQLNKSATSVFGYENAQLSLLALVCVFFAAAIFLNHHRVLFLWMNIVDSTKKVAWMKKNDYNLKVLRYMRGMKESKFLSRDKARERGNGTRRRRKSAIFISFLYRKIFLPIFFSTNFRSVRVLEKFSINTLTISFFCCLLLCCYCPFPFLCLYNISSLSPFIALHLPIYCIACVGLTDFNKMLSDWEKIYWKFSIGWRLFSLFFSFLSSLLLLRYIRLLVECVLSEFLYSLFLFFFIYPHTLSHLLIILLFPFLFGPDHELLSSNVVWTSHLAFDFYRFFFLLYNTR